MDTRNEVFEAPRKIKTNGHGRLYERKPAPTLSTERRAMAALELVEGPARWPARQAAALVGISATYLSTARHASAEERQALERGWLTLSWIHNKRRRAPTDAAVERAVKRLGPDRVLRALDRMTASPIPPAL